MVKNVFFYMLTMTAIIITVGIVANIIFAVLGIEIDKQSLTMILGISFVMGGASSVIGLFTSKMMVKKSMGVQVIEVPRTQAEKWLTETVYLLAKKKGVQNPEVGIYNASEMNAFATGWNKNAALVAVSSGLLQQMDQDEIEAVLGHEMSHVSNGDMVTMSLVQGLVNTLVYFFSFIIASAISRNRDGKSSVGVEMAVRSVCNMLFGFLGNIVVMAFSRYREYRADAGSAEVLGKDAMIKALQALQNQTVSKKPDSVKAFCICGIDSLSELFMTHPPLEKRIEALRKLPK